METDGNREKTKKCGERKNAAKQMNINKNVTERKKTPAHVRTNRLDFADEKNALRLDYDMRQHRSKYSIFQTKSH